ncbi:DUF1161 domain-containing protein [Variovorax arabinosiphilus]|uniref:DUF1161 domain-containing protein n=1 Tax=Variovorax arabinosiphilus TaxID=3053498 RepID=UPI0025752555|nr:MULTISPECIES: DUF1161 domain-containing protein [unclassified Variovorax]MDM0120308.1 DUF1161 domain-containing protein [Variovorax sp. J2L1-78]MDM0127780.1 DUF1161 domain-containing protein [Variovorax sp. J2L1-63]MDM0231479.1 DUF1161 domain-containing protein [Variovorax sp. J2R1-6]
MHLGNARAHSSWLLLAACALAGNAAAQDSNNCEAIRAQIESKIAASGVVGFSVTVVDANANASGQVVGSCALGTRKIVYARPSSASTDNAAPLASPRGSAMLTECKDGSAPVGGTCKP